MDTPPKSRHGWNNAVKVMLFLFVLWLVADVISITVLGTNANSTFRTIPAKEPGQEAPGGEKAPSELPNTRPR